MSKLSRRDSQIIRNIWLNIRSAIIRSLRHFILIIISEIVTIKSYSKISVSENIVCQIMTAVWVSLLTNTVRRHEEVLIIKNNNLREKLVLSGSRLKKTWSDELLDTQSRYKTRDKEERKLAVLRRINSKPLAPSLKS